MIIIKWIKEQFNKLEKYEYQPIEIKKEDVNSLEKQRNRLREERKEKEVKKIRLEAIKRNEMVASFLSKDMNFQDIPQKYKYDEKFLYEILLKDEKILCVIPDAIKLSFIKYASQRSSLSLEFNDSLNQKYNDCVAIYKIITNQIQNIEQLNPKYLKDRELICLIIKKDENNWNKLDESIRQDRAIIFQCLRSNINVYNHLSEELKNDKNIVGFMMSQEKSYYHWLPLEKKHKIKYVKKMLEDDGAYISLIPEELKNNKEVSGLIQKYDSPNSAEAIKKVKHGIR